MCALISALHSYVQGRNRTVGLINEPYLIKPDTELVCMSAEIVKEFDNLHIWTHTCLPVIKLIPSEERTVALRALQTHGKGELGTDKAT